MHKAAQSRIRLGSTAVNQAIDLPSSHALREEARVKILVHTHKDVTGQDAQIRSPVLAYKDGTGPPSCMKYVQA